MVREYVAASPEEEAEVLKLESMKQIREAFLQFKSFFLETAANGGGNMGGTQQQLAQAQQLQAQALAAIGDQGLPGDAQATNDNAGESKYGSEHVGEIDEGGGFALGVAASGARPEVLEQKQGYGGSSPLKTGNADERTADAFGNEGLGHNDGAGNDKESRDTQFKRFAEGQGSELHNNFLECMRAIGVLVEDMQHSKSAMKDAQALIERTQAVLDEKRNATADAAESKHDMVDEEELHCVGELRVHKKTFRQCHAEYAQLRKRLSACKEKRVQLETKLLENFEQWLVKDASKRQTGEAPPFLDVVVNSFFV
jgi:hypothetical protein